MTDTAFVVAQGEGLASGAAVRHGQGDGEAHHTARRYRAAEERCGRCWLGLDRRYYARFLQMLLNGGQLDGVRVAGSRHRRLHDGGPSRHDQARDSHAAAGLRLRAGVRGPQGRRCEQRDRFGGEYNWGGAAGTGFWVDPTDQLIAIMMTQTVPGLAQRLDRALFRHAVYQALVD